MYGYGWVDVLQKRYQLFDVVRIWCLERIEELLFYDEIAGGLAVSLTMILLTSS